MNAIELKALIIKHQGKVVLKKDGDNGYQVMVNKIDIVGYINEKELFFCITDLFTDVAIGLMLDIMRDAMHETDLSKEIKGVKYDA